MMIDASWTNAVTTASSMRCPATISAVMPVSAVTSGGTGSDGFVEGGERVSDAGDATVWQVIELDHPQFDDLVPSRIEAGRLGIE